MELKPEPFELAELISDVVQFFSAAAEAKGVSLTMTVGDRPIVVAGEIRLIERVLDNLLDNALRFTPAGGEVSVSCARTGANAIVRIIDTGRGLSVVDHRRLFTRFYRGSQFPDSMSNRAGLGLSIARRIVELHRGAITAVDTAGRGAEFLVSLPVCDWRES